MSTRAEKAHMAERWLPAPEWEGLYEVSDRGAVRSIRRTGRTSFGERTYGGKVLKHIPARYAAVNMTAPGRRSQVSVHTLVLTAFVGPRPDGMQACHGNGNTQDPRLDNLRWGTPKDNAEDKRKHGTLACGDRNGNSRAARARRLLA